MKGRDSYTASSLSGVAVAGLHQTLDEICVPALPHLCAFITPCPSKMTKSHFLHEACLRSSSRIHHFLSTVRFQVDAPGKPPPEAWAQPSPALHAGQNTSLARGAQQVPSQRHPTELSSTVQWGLLRDGESG